MSALPYLDPSVGREHWCCFSVFSKKQIGDWIIESTGFDICDVHERDDLLGAATRKSTAIPALTVELRCTRAPTLVRMRR